VPYSQRTHHTIEHGRYLAYEQPGPTDAARRTIAYPYGTDTPYAPKRHPALATAEDPAP
jgi:hypothetical protein